MKLFTQARPALWCREPIRAGHKLQPQTVLVTGATGFIGRQLCRRLVGEGDRLIVLSRDYQRAQDIFGPHARVVTSLDEILPSQRIDTIVNLAGEPILAQPWTEARRAKLLESRLRITNRVTELIARLERKPKVLINASAIGYYGVRGDAEITEAVRGQPIFQSHLCQTWELAAQAAEQHGVRVCRLRFGLVLGADGGALPGLARPARMRMRVLLGSAQQWVSWIHIDDLLNLLCFCIEHDDLRGGINVTAPHPVRQQQLAEMLAAQFGHSISIRVPAAVLRTAMGEMSQLLVDGQRVLPTKALCHGFQFRYPELPAALRDLLSPESRRTAPMEIMYDPQCPLCETEMNRYRADSQRCGKQWRFNDVADRPELMRRYGLDTTQARKRAYVLDDSGRMVSGLPAIALIWAALPYWRVLARVMRLPVVREASEAFYDFVLSPAIWRWNQRRRARMAERYLS
jgi:uncharacterized protein (TIGR01777 family)